LKKEKGEIGEEEKGVSREERNKGKDTAE